MKMARAEKLLANSWWSRRRVLALARRLLGYIEINGKPDFLEVGCGNGVVSRYLTQKYDGSVTGVDVDPEQIALARRDTGDLPNIRFLEADATSLPFNDGSFDVVLSFGVLHHIPNWLEALKEIKRVLKIGGYFVYADIIYSGWLTKMDSSSKYGLGLVTLDLDRLSSFISKNGFTTIYSSVERALIGRNYEAVYRRN